MANDFASKSEVHPLGRPGSWKKLIDGPYEYEDWDADIVRLNRFWLEGWTPTKRKTQISRNRVAKHFDAALGLAESLKWPVDPDTGVELAFHWSRPAKKQLEKIESGKADQKQAFQLDTALTVVLAIELAAQEVFHDPNTRVQAKPIYDQLRLKAACSHLTKLTPELLGEARNKVADFDTKVALAAGINGSGNDSIVKLMANKGCTVTEETAMAIKKFANDHDIDVGIVTHTPTVLENGRRLGHYHAVQWEKVS